MIRVGILGCASIARRSLAPAFLAHPEFVLYAVASRTKKKAMEFVSGLSAKNDIKTFSYDELVLSHDVDLVYCPLPTGLHYEWVKKCLLSGKNVLCEKSLACSYDEVLELVQIARRLGLFLMESFQFRFHAQNVYVKRLLESGELGDVRHVVARFGFPPFPDGSRNIRYSKSLGGGALLDAGAYVVKVSAYLLGCDLRVLSAVGWSDNEDVDLDGAVMLNSATGAVAQIAYSFHSQYQCGYELWCEKGIVVTTRAFTAPPGFPAKVSVTKDKESVVYSFADNHFQRMLDYIAKSIANKQFEAEYCESLEQARIMEAIRVHQR